MGRRIHGLACASVVALSVWAPAAARAQSSDDANAADRASARELGIAGVMAADKGNCVDAIDKLERAEKLYHAPTTLDRLGECQIDVGHIVEGTENLQRVVREQLPPNPPKAFVTAKTRAQAALKKAQPRIAKLKIAVVMPDGTQGLAVTIDKQPLSAASLGTDRPADPGTHTIEATATGMLPAQQSVTLKDADAQSVTLKLEVDPNAPKTPPPHVGDNDGNHGGGGGDDHHPPPPPPPSGGANKVLAYGLLGLGVAGVAVGSVTGVMALGKKSDLDNQCPDKNNCPSGAQSNIDSGKTLGLVSTIGFIVGGVGLAGGAILLLTGGSGSASAQTTGAKAPTLHAGHVTATPELGAGYVGVRGSF